MTRPDWLWPAVVAWMCTAWTLGATWAVLGYRAKTRRTTTHTTPKENSHA